MRRPTILELLQFILIIAMVFAAIPFSAKNERLERENKRLKAQLAEREPFVLVVEDKTEKPPIVKAEINSDNVDLLARLIMCEMGSDGHPDEQLYNVGSVVINRVNDPRFPNTIRDVIYAPGQYASAICGALECVKPTQRCIEIAADLIVNGSRLPADVVWQSEEPQGTEIVESFRSSVTGTTTYYCR